MNNRVAPNYKNSHPFVIALRLPFYPARTLGECGKKWRLEHELFQRVLAEIIGVDGMTIVNWEKRRTKPIKQSLERLEKILGNLPSS